MGKFHDLVIYDTKDVFQDEPSLKNFSIEAIFSEIKFFTGGSL